MGLWARIKTLFEAKVDKGLNRLEDPKELLDFSLKKMEDNLRSLTGSAVEVATAKKKLDQQRTVLAANIGKYEEQARKALELGQEDLARQALEKKAQAAQRLSGLEGQIASLEVRIHSIAESQAELRHQIELFRSKKEELKAAYEASQAELKVKETITSVGTEAAEVSQIISRAKSRIEDMQARVAAIDELVGEGVVSDVFASSGKDETDRQLDRLSNAAAVEAELLRLKAELANQAMAGHAAPPDQEGQGAGAPALSS